MRVPGTDRGTNETGPTSAARWLPRGWPAAVLLSAWMGLSAGTVMARDPVPVLRIPLEPMGFQVLSQDFLLAGSSMLTVDFVDNDHLLITFGVRRLMKRDPNEPVDGDDRTVGAYLVELPSGKVLAQTEWRLHDRGKYLWSLGHGRFLLRVRDRLTTFAPMADPDGAFSQVPLLDMGRHIVAVLLSSDSDLLTVETTKFAMGSGEASEGFSTDPAPVQINFYRLSEKTPTVDGLLVSSAGTIRTKTAVALPMTAAGRLDVLESSSKDHWLFNFDEHAGKVDELAGFDTTCFPRPTFVGQSEFVAFGCRGSDGKLDLAGFNLKGEEMWQQNFYDSHVSPAFVFAPAAGRFALGRTIVSGEFDPELPLPSAMVTAQEVRVYQSYDGKQLLKIDCSPVERAGQNFALSPDGLRFAVVREALVRHPATKYDEAYTEKQAAVELYALPPLTAEDQAAVKQAQAMAPADTGARIDLALARASDTDTAASKKAVPGDSADKPAAVAPAGALAEQDAPAVPGAETDAGSTGTTAASGDPEPAAPRKAPTLYGPDEKPPQ